MRGKFLGDEDPTDGNLAGIAFGDVWQSVRGPIMVPALQTAVYVCALMSIILFLGRLYLACVLIYVKIMRGKKYTKYKVEAVMAELQRVKEHPKVLVQIPMYNEKEVLIRTALSS